MYGVYLFLKKHGVLPSPPVKRGYKNVHPNTYIVVFRHFDPKNHCFYPSSFLPGDVPQGRVTGVYDTHFLTKTTVSSVFTRCTRLQKMCTPGGPPVFFGNSTLKVTDLFCVHFLHRCASSSRDTGVCSTSFPKNIVSFHVHHLYETTKTVHTGMHAGNFRQIIPKKPCFMSIHFAQVCASRADVCIKSFTHLVYFLLCSQST